MSYKTDQCLTNWHRRKDGHGVIATSSLPLHEGGKLKNKGVAKTAKWTNVKIQETKLYAYALNFGGISKWTIMAFAKKAIFL